MTLEELKAEATRQGYRLVHRDCIRTATVSNRLPKNELHQYKEHVRDIVRSELRQALADFLIRHSMPEIQELPHEWDVEFRADLTILAPRSSAPDSQDYYLYAPLFDKGSAHD